MQFGIYTSNAGIFAEAQTMAQLARDAEAAGWDGFFLSDNLGAEQVEPVGDTWLILAAIAAQTTRIRLGPMVTAIPRRHIGRLARESVTLDHFSRGRLILGVGSGDDRWREYSSFGPAPDARQLGAMLDEGLQVLTALWSGQPVRFQGTYYQIDAPPFLPVPVQQPRIPIWVAGRWPNKKPFRRAAHWDGVYPNAIEGELSPADYEAMQPVIAEQRSNAAPFAVAHGHPMREPLAHPSAEMLAAYQAAGVTWWVADFDETVALPAMRRYLQGGPPRI